MKLRSLLAAILVLAPTTASLNAFANASAANTDFCNDALSHFVRSENTESTNVLNLEVKILDQGEAGQILITRIGDHPWKSVYNPIGDDGDARLGDPRRFFKLFWEYSLDEISRIARYFGYELLDDRQMLAPGVEMLQARVAALELDDPPNFYATQGHHPIRAFLERFAANRGIPMDIEGLLRIHDLSNHNPLGIPPQVLRHAQRQVQYLLKFITYIENSHASFTSSPFSTDFLQAILDDWLLLAANNIDAGTGNFMVHLTQRGFDAAIPKIYSILTVGGRSPREYLRTFVLPHPNSYLTRLERPLQDWMLSRLREFSALQQDPDYSRLLYQKYDPVRFTQAIRQRIDEVATRALAKSN